MEKVTFEKSDYDYPHLKKVATEIASFLERSGPYIFKIFIEFMRTNINYTVINYKTEMQKWFSVLIKNPKTPPPDILKLKVLCKRFFEVCKTDDEIGKMRGLVPEKLFELVFEKRHEGKKCNIGYGVKVLINGKPVLYRPRTSFETKEDSDGNRQTVDAGFWDGSIGEFAEIKLHPFAFRTKDINYLKLLVNNLDNNDILYRIFLVTLGNKDLIKQKLQRLNLIDEELDKKFILIGKDEFFQLRKTA